jgi:hypothetical protein
MTVIRDAEVTALVTAGPLGQVLPDWLDESSYASSVPWIDVDGIEVSQDAAGAWSRPSVITQKRPYVIG